MARLPPPTSVAVGTSSLAPSAASEAEATTATGSSPYPPMSGSALCRAHAHRAGRGEAGQKSFEGGSDAAVQAAADVAVSVAACAWHSCGMWHAACAAALQAEEACL
jgi:hypothetical protein